MSSGSSSRSPQLLAPRSVRCGLLKAAKYFTCGCARCVDELDLGRALPCAACEGQTSCSVNGSWMCASCGGGPSENDIRLERDLVSQALSGALDAAALEARHGWHGHWCWAASLWSTGLARLRGGVERGDHSLARSGWPMLRYMLHLLKDGPCRLRNEWHPPMRVVLPEPRLYFAWVVAHHAHALQHASGQCAETYACLAAMDCPDAYALAVQLSASFLPALVAEYGPDDEHNCAMQRLCRSRCGHCGVPAASHCARCHLVAFCSAACQRAAWKSHKLQCTHIGATAKCSSVLGTFFRESSRAG